MTEQSVQIGTFCNKILFKIFQYYTAFFLKVFDTELYLAPIQDFFFRGVQAWRPENSLDNVFFIVLILIYSLQRGSNGFITEKSIIFSKDTDGVQNFPGGGGGGPTFFQGGPNANFYRNRI